MREDTIAALSTPVGEGGIGIVRLSGPRAVEIVDRLFRPTDGLPLGEAPSHLLRHGHIVSDGRAIDEVLVVVMRAPRSYTREDVVEIDGHGGIVALRSVLDLVLAGGARLAERGEFTERAFLSGRLSLDQASSVLDVVRARTRLGLEAAVDRLGGRFTREVEALCHGIREALAHLEVTIDFPDADAEPGEVLPAVERLLAQADRLLARAEEGRIVRDGLVVAIIGRTNVGKSTLLNALLAEDRAIVAPTPGTTRDTVEAEAAVRGVPVHLIDTAGLRETRDPVETEGVRRAERAIERADLLLLLLDRSAPLTGDDVPLLAADWGRPAVLVLSKVDLPRRLEPIDPAGFRAVVEVSAKTGEGMERLSEAILRLAWGGGVPQEGTALLLDAWERDLLRRVRNALSRASSALSAPLSPDVVAEELRLALAAAARLTGIDVGEEILREVFSRFCVGK